MGRRTACALYVMTLLSLAGHSAHAQGFACDSALDLGEVDDYCSAPREFTTEGAPFAPVFEACDYSDDDGQRAGWFKFTARERGVTVSIPPDPEGSLGTPRRVVLLGGGCGDLQVIGCGGDFEQQLIPLISTDELVPGEEYFVWVSGMGGNAGTFALCVRGFDPDASIQSDCATAKPLCGQPQRFSVDPFAATRGDVADELPPGNCLGGFETITLWYTFVAANDGRLVFDIVSDDERADVDFAVFRLPGGLTDCGEKEVLRCTASGGEGCNGSVGMREGETDVSEPPGCQGGNNSYVAPLDCSAGEAYALFINVFDPRYLAFEIDFAGSTVEFAGPPGGGDASAPAFDFERLSASCDAATYRFTAEDDTPDVEWDFGPGATPRRVSGRSAEVTFAGPATTREISVRASACGNPLETSVEIAFGEGDGVAIEVADASEGTCDGGAAFDFAVAGGAGPGTTSYAWDFGAGATPPTASGPGPHRVTYPPSDGTSEVTLTSAGGACGSATATREVSYAGGGGGGANLGMPTVTDASCAQAGDGVAELPPGGTRYVLDGVDNGDDPRFEDLAPGTYAYVVTTAEGCEISGELTVGIAPADGLGGAEFADVSVDAASCGEAADGRIAVVPAPGVAYALDGVALGDPYERTGLTAGTYTLSAISPQGCPRDTLLEVGAGTVSDLGELVVADASCAQAGDGVAELPPGGTRYVLNGVDNGDDPRFEDLVPGTYAYIITTAEGCEISGEVTVGIAPADGLGGAEFADVSVDAASCAAAADGTVDFPPGGTRYVLDGDDNGDDPRFEDLVPGTYAYVVTTAEGCEVAGELTVGISTDGDGRGLGQVRVEPATCPEAADGRIALALASGATATLADGRAAADGEFDGLRAGSYAVTVTFADGCGRDSAVAVAAGDGPDLPAPVITDASCADARDGAIALPTGGARYLLGDLDNGADPRFGDLGEGAYAFTVVTSAGCTVEDTARVGAGPGPSVALGPDLEVAAGAEVAIVPQISGTADGDLRAFTYEGLDDVAVRSRTLDLVAFTPLAGAMLDVTLNVTDAAGCQAGASVRIRVGERVTPSTTVANAFSPNGDGRNDRFDPYAGSAATAAGVVRTRRLEVFDRWGGLVYRGLDLDPGDPAGGWDGTGEGGSPAAVGVYTYTVEVELTDGERVAASGEVHLLR